MLNTTESVLIPIFAVIGSLLFMAGLNRIWAWEQRGAHNDLIGWQLSILGTTYAVILGFMLYAVWSNFGAADLNVDLEANALVNVYQLAAGLPEQQRVQLQMLARSYAEAVIDQDWPEMARNQVPDQSQEINRDMWKMLMTVKVASPSRSPPRTMLSTNSALLPNIAAPGYCKAPPSFPLCFGSYSSLEEL